MTTQTMGTLLKTTKGKKPKTLLDRDGPGLVPYIDISAVEHGTRRQFADPSEAKIAKAGTLVMVWDGARSGWVGFTPFDGALGSTLVALDSPLEKRFLASFLRAQFDLINSNPRGTGIPHVNPDVLKDLEVPVLTSDEQLAIAALTETVGASVATVETHLSSARDSLQRFRQAILSAACCGRLTNDWRQEHPDTESLEHTLLERAPSRRRGNQSERAVDLAMPTLPPTYVVAYLGECADLLEYGTSEPSEAHKPGAIPVLRMGNIQDGSLDVTNLKFRVPDAEMQRLILRDGDLLFNRTNSPELVGKSAVFHETAPMSFASYLIRVRFASELAEPDFVNYWLNSAWGRAWARLAKTDGVSQSNINGSKLAMMQIPLPPLSEQKAIVDRASRILRQIEDLERRVDSVASHIDQVSRSILASAFRGEGDVRA